MCSSKIILPGRCYWVIENSFMAGGYPYNPGIDEPDEFLQQLLAIGITAFVDLTEEDELTHYQPILAGLSNKKINYQRFEIQDYSIPDLLFMHKIVSHINHLLETGQHVYLHCRGGIGRTGTVLGCWLCSRGMSGSDSLNELGRLFSVSNAAKYTRSPETDEQRQLVLDYADSQREYTSKT